MVFQNWLMNAAASLPQRSQSTAWSWRAMKLSKLLATPKMTLRMRRVSSRQSNLREVQFSSCHPREMLFLLPRRLFELLVHFRFDVLFPFSFGFQFQGFFPDSNGLGLFAQSHMHVPQVIVNLDMLAVLILDSFQKRNLGLLIFLLLEENPAEAIEVSGVVGPGILVGIFLPTLAVLIQRFTNHLLRFIEVHVMIGPNVAQVVIGPGIIGILGQNVFEMVGRFVDLVHVHVAVA